TSWNARRGRGATFSSATLKNVSKTCAARRSSSNPTSKLSARPVRHFGNGPNRTKPRSEEHTSELQSLRHLVCRLLLEKKNQEINPLHSSPAPPARWRSAAGRSRRFSPSTDISMIVFTAWSAPILFVYLLLSCHLRSQY